jgi:cytidylate kinase
MRDRPIVTIDGPSGAGKTTVSRRLAERASLTRLDTGAMYRACALAARKAGIPWSDGARLGRLCADLDLSFPRGEKGDARVALRGEDVSDAIRTPEIGMGASEVSVHKQVREAMVSLQRKLGERGGVVLEGRDTGTVVFPDAEAKFFLDAAAAVRAKRRFLEWGAGERNPFEEVLREVLRRDIRDSTREHSPLRMAEGAVYIDTTTLTVDEAVEEMLRNLPEGARKGLGL